ncbi:unnamed protein product [Cylicocyclus nassatus]|uniref:Uncharacterized protein n=1 Tax=Cylicocyclus nassatus TaxID=53992 RepID=A0AA36DK79_CYLNA|nr:unnamed protein product [Cylicocyclus nassatus]
MICTLRFKQQLLSRCLSSLFVFSEDQSNTILAPETLPNLFLGLSARHEICLLIGWNPQESSSTLYYENDGSSQQSAFESTIEKMQESSAHRYDSMPTYFGYYPMTSIECKLIKSILSNITGMRLVARYKVRQLIGFNHSTHFASTNDFVPHFDGFKIFLSVSNLNCYILVLLPLLKIESFPSRRTCRFLRRHRRLLQGLNGGFERRRGQKERGRDTSRNLKNGNKEARGS